MRRCRGRRWVEAAGGGERGWWRRPSPARHQRQRSEIKRRSRTDLCMNHQARLNYNYPQRRTSSPAAGDADIPAVSTKAAKPSCGSLVGTFTREPPPSVDLAPMAGFGEPCNFAVLIFRRAEMRSLQNPNGDSRPRKPRHPRSPENIPTTFTIREPRSPSIRRTARRFRRPPAHKHGPWPAKNGRRSEDGD